MKDQTPRTIRAQVGPFAMVPIWILERCQDSRAIHLYALLGKYTNRERRAWPQLETLAKDMGVVQRTVERAVATLRGLGALHTDKRRRPDGSVSGLDFLLIHTPDLPDTGVGVGGESLPDTGVGLLLPLTDTGVGMGPTLVSGLSVLEPDPCNQIVKAGTLSRPAPAGAEDPGENVGVITKLAHEVLDLYDGVGEVHYAEVEDAIERRCRLYGIAHNRDVVMAAMESALFQRRLAGKPSVMAGSVGEAAFRMKGRG